MLRPTRHISLVLAVSLAMLLGSGSAQAHASSNIEGVWSFNGGAVDVVEQPNGTFTGVVSMQTKFAQCFHLVNEDMWTEIRLQPDGSYWGFHQWYFEPTAESPGCVVNPAPGPTAWRVLTNSKGEPFLRVCFSAPGSGSQPTIAPDGSSTKVTYGCVDSAAIGSTPVVSGREGSAKPGPGEISFSQTVSLPSAKRCVRAGKLTISVRDPRYDPFKEILVRVNGKQAADVRGTKKLRKAIVIGHLPSGSFKVKVTATTVLDQRLSGTQSYRSCTKHTGKIKLHQIKPRPKKHKH